MSLIRVIDTVLVNVPPGAPEDFKPAVLCVAVIQVKAGELVGSFNKLRVSMRSPEKKTKALTETVPMVFTGGAQGANIQINLTVVIEKYGIFWFDVLWGDEVLTSIPLEVKPGEQAAKQ